MRTSADQLDLSALPPASRSKVRDYYRYLLERGRKTKRLVKKQKDEHDIDLLRQSFAVLSRDMGERTWRREYLYD